MRVGARIFKTGIAITLALFIAKLLNMPSPVFAGIAATFAIKPTIYRSYLSIIEQVQGNVIGAIIAVILFMAFGNHLIIVGFGAIIIIILMLKLKLENNVSLALVTMIVIMETPGENFLQVAGIRFSTLFLGIMSSFIVNLIFLPPKYEKKLYVRIAHVTEDLLKFIRITSRHEVDYSLLKDEIPEIKERVYKVEQLYTLFKEDRAYSKKKKHDVQRKIVLYKQMVTILNLSFIILKRLYHYKNDIVHLPKEIQEMIQEQIEFLVNEHEKLLLMFLGKVKGNAENQKIGDQQRNELMDLFHQKLKDETFRADLQSYHIMNLLALLVDYQEELEHLEKLIDVFQTYHKHNDQNDITLAELDEQ
ncbi:aromatic acid exporter family protein [Heyndrickxia ginsengihumi]|uniref:aromatic acid exporter family protein n=1 Tax=Heyndrickxia ginsengihumi TaxID=363870 RepID=UPI00046F068D|nr:aromatic acid exporter family protein [Heyndrickxia ginsengihumi]MCM3024479.1 aromatic acid exporter family protein [Heyndrickxia ginsengihumi]